MTYIVFDGTLNIAQSSPVLAVHFLWLDTAWPINHKQNTDAAWPDRTIS